MNCGKEIFLTKWVFHEKEIRSKCPMSCKNIVKPDKCQDHRNKDCLNEILSELYRRHDYLMELFPTFDILNKYNFIFFKKKGTTRVIYLGQDYTHGKSIKELRDAGKFLSVLNVANAIIDSLVLLQAAGQVVTHGYLNEKSIFVENGNRFRLADYDLIPYLMYLKGTHFIHKVNDLEALGSIISGFNIKTSSARDFVNVCRSGTVFSFVDLKQHPFLGNIRRNQNNRSKPTKGENRLKYFRIEKKLGAGSFGIVLQAKSRTVNKSYAFKLINTSTKRKKYVEQMEREAKIMSDRCGNQHTVKYIASWKQSFNISDLREYIDDEELMDFIASSSHTSDLSEPNELLK